MIDLLLAYSLFTLPENGTWYDKQYPYSFARNSVDYGIGVSGNSWSVDYEAVGKEHSFAYVCPENCVPGKQQYHWNGRQDIKGFWAKWEPSVGPVFAQTGVGLYKPNFTVSVPDLPGNFSNNHIMAGYLVGVGYKQDTVAFVVNGRYCYSYNKNGELPNLGKYVFTAGIRVSF